VVLISGYDHDISIAYSVAGTATAGSGDFTIACITGCKGVDVSKGQLSGDGVTIFLESGGMTVNGNVSPVEMRAPVESPDPAPVILGILFFLAYGNESTVKLTGTGHSFYLGTIFAPDGDLYVSGTSDTHSTINTQLIGGMSRSAAGRSSISISMMMRITKFPLIWTCKDREGPA